MCRSTLWLLKGKFVTSWSTHGWSPSLHHDTSMGNAWQITMIGKREREAEPSERPILRWFVGLFFNMPLTTMVLWSVMIIFVIYSMKRPSSSLLINGNEFCRRYSSRAIIFFPFLHSESFHLPRSMIPSCLQPILWVETDRILMNFFPKFPRMKIVVSERRR